MRVEGCQTFSHLFLCINLNKSHKIYPKWGGRVTPYSYLTSETTQRISLKFDVEGYTEKRWANLI